MNNFTPTGQASLAATNISANVALPATGTPATALVTNLGPNPAFVLLGADAVVVTPATGLAVLPGTSVALGIGANTFLAAITSGASPAVLNIALGT